MLPYDMTVADHVAWERSQKCAVCYRGSLFEDPGDKQRTAFDQEVERRTNLINARAKEITPAVKPERVFPVMEGTFDLHALGLTVRVWLRQDYLHLLNYEELLHQIAKPMSQGTIEGNYMSAEAIIRLVADMPGVAAVQVQGKRLPLSGGTYHFEYQPGVVGYTEWP